VTRLSDGQVEGSRDSVSPSGQHVVPGRSGRAGRFARLALGLDDLRVAISCLRLASQPDLSPSSQVQRALLSAMVVAYGRLFFRSEDEASGLPSHYEPEGRLRTVHLHLLGIHNLQRQHVASSARRVQVGPARGRSEDSHVAPGGRIAWMVLSDPLGPLDLQQVDTLFRHLHARFLADAGQLCDDLFVGRGVPLRDVVVGDA
jgi:hypothetical protein